MTTVKKNRKFVAVLGLGKLTTVQISAKAKLIVSKMTGNVHFPTPTPTLTAVTAQIAVLDADITTALTKAKGTASPMHVATQALESQLRMLAGYVQNIANADQENGVSIIQSAGMDVRKPAARTPKTFSAKVEKVPGEVLLNTKAVPRSSYIYQMTTDPTLVSGWSTMAISNTAKYLKTGLTSGTKYFFRVAIITKSLQGDWSPVISVVAS